jgi:hypothetical protein
MDTYENIWVFSHPAYIEAEKRHAEAEKTAELAKNAVERARKYSYAVTNVLREQYRAAYPPEQQEAIDEGRFMRDAQSAVAEYGLQPTRPDVETAIEKTARMAWEARRG